MKPYNLLSSLLEQIEQNVHEKNTLKNLALQNYITDVHLQRLFKFAFGVPIASYIRSRRLASSVEPLLNTNLRIIDVALDCGFEYERAYIRAFKREYGVTPGEYRRSGEIIKIIPPITLCDKNKLDEGMIYGPDIVMVPGFYVAGQLHRIKIGDAETPPAVARQFEPYMSSMSGVVNSNIYIGLSRYTAGEDYTWYLPSVQVYNLDNIPEGFTGYKFATAQCLRFRYIGEHHYHDINWRRAKHMYDAINHFVDNLDETYSSLRHELFFERVDLSAYDGTYCQMEWFTPVKKK